MDRKKLITYVSALELRYYKKLSLKEKHDFIYDLIYENNKQKTIKLLKQALIALTNYIEN